VLAAGLPMVAAGNQSPVNVGATRRTSRCAARRARTCACRSTAGQVVMINFWATWCGPCRQEMPKLDEIFSRYERAGFTLLGVNIDEDTARAQRLADELGVSFPLLFDSEQNVSRLYDVQAMPMTVLVDRKGKVRSVHYGYKAGMEQRYLDEVRALLREE
jgi:thiol-disulfide isomerase/thioredoxin